MNKNTKKEIHYICWADQPDIQFICDKSWDTPAWRDNTTKNILDSLEPNIYFSDSLKRFYTFDKENVTCIKCIKFI